MLRGSRISIHVESLGLAKIHSGSRIFTKLSRKRISGLQTECGHSGKCGGLSAAGIVEVDRD